MYFDPSNKDQSIERIEKKVSALSWLPSLSWINAIKTRTSFCIAIFQNIAHGTVKKIWNKRKRKGKDGIPETIGRLYSIHPTQVEFYATILLLNNVRGPCSYEDLKRVNGFIHPSFQDAAVARKLLKDDMMWIKCMKEANDSYTSICMLRKLFVSIILKCEISNHK